MNATAIPAPIAAKCSTTNCDKAATLRLVLPLPADAPIPAMSWDVCHNCASLMRAACAAMKMDPLQCPGCLTIQPNPVSFSLDPDAKLYECTGCEGIYGTLKDPDVVRRPLWCNCGRSHEGTYYYDVKSPAGREHGWACGNCQGITQVG